ncbi:GNAT family N-acetyltransferase [Shewanella sp. UCD-KL12]|uniref:GNAT family N-acetyltransferase n=1 Tax=Shewanella sp. UCD-KL12 TaxID=1917163 RepID=UPI000970D7CE|nr:GNAT family N-acetyltransferase [Shewanella sp. UCD-KL12]
MIISAVPRSKYKDLLAVWEASVRCSHDFLCDSEINRLKPLILEHYFDAVDLRCIEDKSGSVLGFCGVADGNVEMLFVEPNSMGLGAGKALITYAIKHQAATKVDVNEQNPKALAFYLHMGFSVIGRSPLDSQGKPYPLLHMALNTVDALV